MASRFLCVLLLTLVASVSCETQRSIVTELLESEYTGFVKLLEQANLLDELETHVKNHDGLTVLPTTDHFLLNKVSPVLLSWLKRKENVPTLRRVLLNHFVPGRAHPKEWTVEKTLNGLKIDHRSTRGLHYLGGVPVKKVVALEASDGIAHSLDGLLVPEDVKIELANFLDVSADEVHTGSVEGFSLNGAIRIALEAEAPASSTSVPPTSVSSPSSATSPTSTSSPASSPVSSPVSTPASTSTPETSAEPASAPSAETPPVSTPSPSPSAPGPSPSPSLSLLIDILSANGNFSTFLDFLKQYGLETTLEQQLLKPTTILAPNDNAFSQLSSAQLTYLKERGNVDDLLLFHVLDAYASTDDFLTGANSSPGTSSKAETNSDTAVYYYETLYTGHPLAVYVTSGVITFGPQNASAVAPNICNSTTCGDLAISGLNGVMIPADLLLTAPPSSSGIVSVNILLTALLALASVFAFI